MTHAFKQPAVSRLVHRQQRGLSLIELLVALAIGAVLIFGATQAYVDSRNAYTVNETVSRLQETARYAMSILEPDIRMSNNWGLLKGAETIQGKLSQTVAEGAGMGLATSQCGPNYGIDLENNLEGTNGGYITTAYTADCKPFHDAALQTADTITVRRASIQDSTVPPSVGPLRICSTRTAGVLVTDTSAPLCLGIGALPDPIAQINDLMVNLYYIDRDSEAANGYPSLRRYFLDVSTNSFIEREVVAGVEDMQVQFGVDPSGGVGATGGAATQYLDWGPTLAALLSGGSPAQIVSVRIWLLVRSDAPEVGFTDDRVYVYGNRGSVPGKTGDLTSVADMNKAYQPSLNADASPLGLRHFRRVLISRTIQIRNALGT
jgi:type IV pilus assembly protein PilW